MLVAVLAAALAVAEIGAKSTQNAYLTHHVQAADYWGFYQTRNLRAGLLDATAELMASLPNAADPQVQRRIEAARAEAARLRDDPQAGDGAKQIEAMARAEERRREVAFRKYHSFEATVGALEIAIVLASVSVVIRVRWLTYGAGAIGGLAVLFGLATAAGLL
jgi:ABC-type transport system involved in cytochrome c biogenesis permease subunit